MGTPRRPLQSCLRAVFPIRERRFGSEAAQEGRQISPQSHAPVRRPRLFTCRIEALRHPAVEMRHRAEPLNEAFEHVHGLQLPAPDGLRQAHRGALQERSARELQGPALRPVESIENI